MNDLHNKFVEKIIEQTKEGLLKWDLVKTIINKYKAEDFDYILFTNEFHRINFLNSYAVINDELNIFLLDETFESGEDGTINEELNLYVVEGVNGRSYRVPIDKGVLYELKDIIISKFIDSNSYLDRLLQRYIENN